MKIDLLNLNKRQLHDLLVSIILPRPIAFVSTVAENGVFNVAPFSAFAPLTFKPALVCFQIGWKKNGKKKDTLANIEFSDDFVINVVNENLAEAMNQTSAEYPSAVDEFKEVGLTPMKSELVKAPMVAESPINLECKLKKILTFGRIPTGGSVIIGEIILVHVKEELFVNDQIDPYRLKAIGRLGGPLYCRTTDIFKMERPFINDKA